jgi:hypothetical protein
MKKISLALAALAVAGSVQADVPPITGENTVGFAAVAAPAEANTIITVPFEACLGGGAAGMLSDLVATSGLTSHASDPAQADQLVVLTSSGGELYYYYYWLKASEGWMAITTSKLMPDGSTQAVTPPAASAFEIARGLGFWVKRVASGGSALYVKGQLATAKQSTDISEGLNLVGYGTVQSFSLNDSGIDWTGAYGGTGNTSTSDKIVVVNADGSFTEYFYFVKPVGWPAGYDALSNKWITKSYTLASGTLPAGRGFWYLRRGAGSFTFKPDGE